jgi:hypothetical protein
MTNQVTNSILAEADSIINGVREATHGQKERSFELIAQFWNTYLNGRKAPAFPITGVDVALMMDLMKLARFLQGTPIRDHFVDKVGYTAIACELLELENSRQNQSSE